MQITLIACIMIADREKFLHERFCPTDHIFMLLANGKYTVTADEGTITVNPGEGMLFRKGIVYERRIIEPITVFLFRHTADAPVFPTDHICFADTARIHSTIAMLEHSCRNQQSFVGAVQNHLFHDLINLYRYESQSAMTPVGLQDPVIAEVLTNIQNHAHRSNPVSWYAEQSQLSYVQFYRRFKSAIGMSPKEYIIRLRIDRARYLLLEEPSSVSEIAHACGFESEYYFSSCFKKTVGVSPSDFRRNGT